MSAFIELEYDMAKTEREDQAFVRGWYHYVDANAGISRDLMRPMIFEGREYTPAQAKGIFDEIMRRELNHGRIASQSSR